MTLIVLLWYYYVGVIKNILIFLNENQNDLWKLERILELKEVTLFPLGFPEV